MLTGSIEDSGIFALPNLDNLDLSSNLFSGSIPTIPADGYAFNNATNSTSRLLRGVYMNDNLLSGSIPENIGSLSPGSLIVLAMNQNDLTGTIPSSIGNFSELQILSFANNTLTGPLPESISNLTNLTTIELFSNQLTGSPLEDHLFDTLNSMWTLNIDENYFDGKLELPALLQPESYINIQFGRNNFVGTLPTEIGLFTNLFVFSIGFNMGITGTVPTEISLLSNLEGMWIQGTSLVGSVNELCSNLLQPSWGFYADCIEEDDGQGVECSCCLQCCNKALLDPDTFDSHNTLRDEFCVEM
jgi:hypothetical protein